MSGEGLRSTLGETATDEQAAAPLVACTGAESPRTTPAVSPSVGLHTTLYAHA